MCMWAQPACGERANKYIEFDGVVLSLGLLLQRTPVYRHLMSSVLRVPGMWVRRQGRLWGCSLPWVAPH